MWEQQKRADDFVALKGVLCVWSLLDSSHLTTNLENLVLAVAVHGRFCFWKLFLNIKVVNSTHNWKLCLIACSIKAVTNH